MNIANPWSIQVELTEGCTRLCSWCGLQSIRAKPNEKLKFMSFGLAFQIAQELAKWLSKVRIEFAMSGEPLLNPNVVKIIKAFRGNFPKAQLQLTTNGDVFRKNQELVWKLFSSGLNWLVVDVYDGDKAYKFFTEIFQNSFNIPVLDFYKGNNVYYYKGYKHKEIVLMKSLFMMKGESFRRGINNQGGNLPLDKYKMFGKKFLNSPLIKGCSNVFRELVVKYDGVVPICCMDYRRQMIVGKFPEEHLAEIWKKKEYQYIRTLLKRKRRLFNPCALCDYVGFKEGLCKEPKVSISEKEMLKVILKNNAQYQ